jgi:hypothetical protein
MAYRPCELFSDILIPIPIKHYYCLVFIYRVIKTSSNVWTKLLYENSKQNVMLLFFRFTFLLKWSIVGVNSNVFLQRSGVGSCVSAQLTFQRLVTWNNRGTWLKTQRAISPDFFTQILERGRGGQAFWTTCQGGTIFWCFIEFLFTCFLIIIRGGGGVLCHTLLYTLTSLQMHLILKKLNVK